MKKIVSLTCVTLLGAVAMVASGHAGQDPAPAQDEGVDPRIGPEVRRICFGRNINGWRTLKKQDDVILLERGINHWYRVELSGSCDYSALNFAQTIGIDSRPAGGCVTRGDIIIVHDSTGFDRRCFITDIYEWDEDAVAEDPSEDDDA